MPLPAPGVLWRAETAEAWYAEAKTAAPTTLDDAMRALFTPNATTASYLDDFALYIVLCTILRGVFDLGEGRRESGTWHDLTDLWLKREEAVELVAELGGECTRRTVMDRYAAAVGKVSEHSYQGSHSGEHGGTLGNPLVCSMYRPASRCVKVCLARRRFC